MRTSATGRTNNRVARAAQRGVTLVEFLIVLAIIAMVTGLAIANAPPGRSEARVEAERFAAVIDRAAQSAIATGTVIGLDAEPAGYVFYIYERGAWKAAEKTMPQGSFPAAITVAIESPEPAKRNEPDLRRSNVNNEDKEPEPAFRFAPTGETSPFTATFQQRDVRYAVTLDAAGEVMVRDDQ